MRRTTSEPRYATASHPSGPLSSSPTWPRRRAFRVPPLSLDLGPGLHPGRVVLAHRPTGVATLRARRRPIGDLAEVGLVVGVKGLAESLVRRRGTGLRVGRRRAEPPRHLGVDLGRD